MHSLRRQPEERWRCQTRPRERYAMHAARCRGRTNPHFGNVSRGFMWPRRAPARMERCLLGHERSFPLCSSGSRPRLSAAAPAGAGCVKLRRRTAMAALRIGNSTNCQTQLGEPVKQRRFRGQPPNRGGYFPLANVKMRPKPSVKYNSPDWSSPKLMTGLFSPPGMV